MIYDATTEVTDSTVLYVPGSIVLPQLRYAAPSGTLAQGDTIEGMITVKDSSGNIKPLEYEGFKVVLNDYPSADSSQEILAVLYLNFVLSNKAPVIIPDVI